METFSMTNRTTAILTLLLLTVSLGFVSGVAADERLRVYTVNYPLQYFAQRIAGEHAEVVFPAPRDVDPAFWMPDVKTLDGFQHADLIVLNGANYAKWIDRVSLPRRKLLDTSKTFSQALVKSGAAVAHSHGSGPAHGHAGTAFTTWLDLQQAILQATAIKQALIRKRPAVKEDFERNFAQLERDLQQLDADFKHIATQARKQVLLASHPVYQYLARAYALEFHGFLWEPDVFPDESQWKQFAASTSARDARWMVWEKTPLAESVARLRRMNIDSIVFDPCANVPQQGDFLSVMKSNLVELRRALLPEDVNSSSVSRRSILKSEGTGS